MVTPRVASSSRRKICASPRTSSWAVGSSRSTTPAPRRTAHTARARATRCHSPPDRSIAAGVLRREHACRAARGGRPRRRRGRRARPRRGAPCGATLSRSDSSKRVKSWNTAATRAAPLVHVEVAQVGAVDLDGARRRVVEPAQQLGERGLAGAVLADDGQRRAGRDRQVEAAEHLALGAWVGERDVAEADLRRLGSPAAAPCSTRDSAPTRPVLLAEPEHGGDRCRRPVERPVEAAEGDQRRADGHLGVDDRPVEGDRPVGEVAGQRHEDADVGHRHQQHADHQRPLAEPGGRLLEVEQLPAPLGEPVEDPVGQPEDPQLLGRRRVDGEPEGVLGVQAGLAHLVGVAVLPDRALAQQPVGRAPGAARAPAAPTRCSRPARRPRRRRCRGRSARRR